MCKIPPPPSINHILTLHQFLGRGCTGLRRLFVFCSNLTILSLSFEEEALIT